MIVGQQVKLVIWEKINLRCNNVSRGMVIGMNLLQKILAMVKNLAKMVFYNIYIYINLFIIIIKKSNSLINYR